jgi:hypothetical protein
MRWEEEETPLTNMAYFNSLLCKTTIRLYSQQVVNQRQYGSKVGPRLVQPKGPNPPFASAQTSESDGREGPECRVSPKQISQFCSLLTSSRVFQGLLWC